MGYQGHGEYNPDSAMDGPGLVSHFNYFLNDGGRFNRQG